MSAKETKRNGVWGIEFHWTAADKAALREEIEKINATPVGTIEPGPDGKNRYVPAAKPKLRVIRGGK